MLDALERQATLVRNDSDTVPLSSVRSCTADRLGQDQAVACVELPLDVPVECNWLVDEYCMTTDEGLQQRFASESTQHIY